MRVYKGIGRGHQARCGHFTWGNAVGSGAGGVRLNRRRRLCAIVLDSCGRCLRCRIDEGAWWYFAAFST
jgi:hypothetical protein